MSLPNPKVGALVRNERRRRWGQVLWDVKKMQFETGDPSQIRVWDTELRRSTEWSLGDISAVVEKGRVVFDDQELVNRLDAELREVCKGLNNTRFDKGLEYFLLLMDGCGGPHEVVHNTGLPEDKAKEMYEFYVKEMARS
jgi:hypothetical protein